MVCASSALLVCTPFQSTLLSLHLGQVTMDTDVNCFNKLSYSLKVLVIKYESIF